MAANARAIQDELIAAVNDRYGYNLTWEQVTFGLPVMVNPAIIDLSDPELRNSRVDFTVGGDGGPTITAHIKYNRLSLGEFFQFYSPDFDDLDPAITSAHGLLTVIGERLQLELDPADFEDSPITPVTGGRTLNLTAAANSYVYYGSASLNLLEIASVDPTHNVDLTLARVYDNDQSGDGFITGGISATVDSLTVSNANAGVNAFFDPYETGPVVASFYMEWEYTTHYLYNVNLYLTAEGEADYDPNMANVYWPPGSSLYIEQRFAPKSVQANFVDNVNVSHLNRTANPSVDGSLTMISWYESAQPTDLVGGIVRTNVDIVFGSTVGGHILCTRHYLNGYLAAAYVWASGLALPTTRDRQPLGNWATTTMNTNGDGQPYAISDMKFGPRDEVDPNYEEIVFDLGDMTADSNSGVLSFTINANDKIVAVAVGSDGDLAGGSNGGDIDLYVNPQAGAPGSFFSYAQKGENGGTRECISVRDQGRAATNAVYNFVVYAYEESKNVRARVIKIKA